MTSAASRERGQFAEAGAGDVISERLAGFLEDMLSGQAPNAGRFCGNCYHPLAAERSACPHCGRGVDDRPPVPAVPAEIVEAYRIRRGREGLVVRTFAWAGLTLGVVLALVPLAFAGVSWWSAALFFGLMVFFYILSANLANSVGDALGYRWGRATFRRRWEAFVARRDAQASEVRVPK